MNALFGASTQDHLPICLAEFPELQAILSHLSLEISRPLRSLKIGSESLLEDSLRIGHPEQSSHLQMLVTLCDDLLQMTRDYLNEGLVRGARPLKLEKFKLGALAVEIDQHYREEASRRQMYWHCGLEGTDMEVSTDAGHFQQIIGRILDNAFRFTPDGGAIHVVARQNSALNRWSFSVTDNGFGIPDDYLDMVFNPFFRLPRDDREGRAGLGIGLTICREMVERLQGQIQIRPVEHGGTQVAIEFPSMIRAKVTGT